MYMHKHNNKTTENIKIAFLVNLLFSFIEIIGSFLTNSVSILSDAIHDFGDSMSIGISYLLEKKSKKSPDNKFTYGYLRYSLLGALFTSMILLIGSFIVVYNAIPRLIHPEEINHDAMIIFAIFGIIINGYAAYKTHNKESHNERAINLHMLEDVFGWIAILIGSIFIKTMNLLIIDPILSILIALYILFHVYKNIKNLFYIFMEKTPSNIDITKIKKDIEKKYESIKNIHHIHVWTIDGNDNYMTAHIKLKDDLNKDEIINLKKDIKETLITMNLHHITLEFEYVNEQCNNLKC